MPYKRLKFIVIIAVIFITASSHKNMPADDFAGVIKVMTYNVHHCNPPGKPGIIDVNAIAAVIKKQNADIVAVQEVDVNTNRSGKMNEAEQLARKAGYPSFFFAKAMDFNGGQYGILILSKHTLTDTKTYRLPLDAVNGGEQRLLVTAKAVLPGGRTFLFGCTHLEAYNKTSRELQVKEICRIAAETSLPFIVAGDFNSTEGSEAINMLDQLFSRTCNNCPPTFGEDGKTGAIDFITFTPKEAFSVSSHKVVQDTTASDHMPVVAELQWK